MQGCTPEWRTNFKTGVTTEDSKPEYGNSEPENFVHPPFKISGSAPGKGPLIVCLYT